MTSGLRKRCEEAAAKLCTCACVTAHRCRHEQAIADAIEAEAKRFAVAALRKAWMTVKVREQRGDAFVIGPAVKDSRNEFGSYADANAMIEQVIAEAIKEAEKV